MSQKRVPPLNLNTADIKSTRGTKVLRVDAQGDVFLGDVLQYGYLHLSSLSFFQSLDVSGQTTDPIGGEFKPDGTKFFLVAFGFGVLEYDLSTAWDITSASFSQYIRISEKDDRVRNTASKPDGTKFFITGNENDNVYEYDLSTAWDITSASFNQSLDISGQDGNVRGIASKPDGTKFYLVGVVNDNVYEYDLSTAWDISSASFNQSLDISGQDSSPGGIAFKPDGAKFYFAGGGSLDVYGYDLSTAWDISSASFNQSLDISGQDSTPGEIAFKPDGAKFYLVGGGNDNVYEYTLW